MNPNPAAALRTDKATVFAWGLWDWGSAAFNAVLVTFIFSVYLTDSVGESIDSAISPASWLGYAFTVAGIAIALVAPVMGRTADRKGTRRRSLALWTAITVVWMFALSGVRNDAPIYFWIGIAVLALASVTFEFAEVSYFAQLRQVSTADNVGRVSGFGWSMGYFGGIVLLLICYLGFVAGDGETRGMLGLSTEGGFNIRMVAVLAAAWFLVFALPVLFRVPEIAPQPGAEKLGIAGSYRQLFAEIRELWHADRRAVLFLIAAAVFRDGLAGVFTFGAILAVSVYGLSAGDVLLFGVAANVVSALGAVAGGFLDDKLGPKPVILVSLILLVATSLILLFLDGSLMFWIFGLLLCLFVGPAQSAARSFLARVTPPGREGQMFGLYVTTGRAVSWMAPAAFSLCAMLVGGDRWGILGLAGVLALGAALLWPLHQPRPTEAPVSHATTTAG